MDRTRLFIGVLSLILVVSATVLWTVVRAQTDRPQVAEVTTPTEESITDPAATPASPSAQPLPTQITDQLARLTNVLLIEVDGKLVWQPVDAQGLVRQPSSTYLMSGLAKNERVTALYPSPSGREVLVFVDSAGSDGGEGTWKAYVISPPNGRPREVFTSARYGLPFKFLAWRPQSSQVAYWEGTGIWLMDVTTGKAELIARPDVWAGLPYPPLVESLAFSPDGSRMVVAFTLTGSEWEMWVARSDGTEARQLFTSEMATYGLSWSPDGSLIAFVSNDLEVMSPDGQGRRVVGHDFVGGLPPAWSPDGRFIAFTAAKSLPKPVGSAGWSGYQVHIVDMVSGEEKVIEAGERGGEVLPSWSPDGSVLLFLSDRGGKTEVWRADPDGTNVWPVTTDGLPKRVRPVWMLVDEQ